MEHLIELNVLDNITPKTVTLPLSKILYVVWFEESVLRYKVLVVTSINEETGLQQYFSSKEDAEIEYERIIKKWEDYLEYTL